MVMSASLQREQRKRRVIGLVVVAAVVLLQLATDVVAQRESARILARVAFMALELPLLMLALTTSFRWAVRRERSADSHWEKR